MRSLTTLTCALFTCCLLCFLTPLQTAPAAPPPPPTISQLLAPELALLFDPIPECGDLLQTYPNCYGDFGCCNFWADDEAEHCFEMSDDCYRDCGGAFAFGSPAYNACIDHCEAVEDACLFCVSEEFNNCVHSE